MTKRLSRMGHPEFEARPAGPVAGGISSCARQQVESKDRMAHQPNLFTPPPAPAPQRAEPPAPARRVPRWLQRVELFIRVIVRLYLGLLVLVLPWLRMWDDNHLLVLVPGLSHVALSGVARGVVSGLGLLNIWIAIHDALHYNEA